MADDVICNFGFVKCGNGEFVIVHWFGYGVLTLSSLVKCIRGASTTLCSLIDGY